LWDETHPKGKLGTGKTKVVKAEDVQVRFPRDENGNVDVENGKYSDNTEKVMQAKYTDEVRLCLGVATVRLPDGSREGRRCDLIDYTGRVIVSPDKERTRI
jgi:hypothetical protein